MSDVHLIASCARRLLGSAIYIEHGVYIVVYIYLYRGLAGSESLKTGYKTEYYRPMLQRMDITIFNCLTSPKHRAACLFKFLHGYIQEHIYTCLLDEKA